MPPDQASAWQAAERAARDSYGRLLAWLAGRWRDLAAAEDALAEAFAAALRTWPVEGVPRVPDAWLLTAAKRNLLQMQRHQAVVDDPAIALLFASVQQPDEAFTIPDERLKLLLVCAHPAIDEKLHTPLMLQTVLGLDARQIAEAFLTSPAAMAQRLVRAKAQIRDAGIAYAEPERDEIEPRLAAVLEAIYAAYSAGWEADYGMQPGTVDPDCLAEEALYLARLTAALAPASAEALGLLALLLFSQSRRRARLDAAGEFVPLMQQDASRWDTTLIREADQHLWVAAQQRTPGPFQLEAAIQSAHSQRAFTGQTPWAAIAQLYAWLAQQQPGIGARVSQAVAVAEAGDAAAGLALLDALHGEHAARLASYQPYWLARAHLQRQQGALAAAREDYQRALGLSTHAPIRRYLGSLIAALPG